MKVETLNTTVVAPPPAATMAEWEKYAESEDDDSTDVSGSGSDYDSDTDDDDDDDDDDEDSLSTSGFLPNNLNGNHHNGKQWNSMPNLGMQFDVDLDTSQMSEETNSSMRSLFERMNSSNTLTYFQDANEEPPVPLAVQVKPQRAKRSKSTGALLDLEGPDKQSPQSLFEDIIQGITGIDLTEDFWATYFLDVTDERKQSYSMDLVKVMRRQDLETLRTLQQQEGTNLEACNAQGESLIHLACRRRNHPMVKFLVDEANVSVRVRDDWGKTPLHELCWNSRAGQRDQSDSFKLLVREAPQLLFAKDKRGFSPLDYVPKDVWKDWGSFLDRYKSMLRCQVQYIGCLCSCNKLRSSLRKAECLLSSDKL